MSRARSVVIAFGAAAVALSAIGVVLAPAWQRPRIEPRGFDALPPAPPPPTGDAARATRREDITVAVAGMSLGAIVMSPATGGPYPAVVLVQGGGPATRAGLLDQAEALAAAGIVALTYDKRTAGYTFTDRDYGELAYFALAMLGALQGRSDVDPARAGLWGTSEGGWVVPLAAARSDEVAFAILVAAPTMSPGVQLAWAVDDGLRRKGMPPTARRFVSRALALGGTNYVDHDPLPALRSMRQPVLALYGTDDRAVPPMQSAQILADELSRSGNRAYTIRFFGGADHALRVGGVLAPGYLATMTAWIAGLPGSATAGPRVAGPSPVQVDSAVAPPTPGHGRAAVMARGVPCRSRSGS